MLGVLIAGLWTVSMKNDALATYVSLEREGAGGSGVVESGVNEKDYQARVITLEGEATAVTASGKRVVLTEGDVLMTDDVVDVTENAQVDIAFDRNGKNVTRLEGSSTLRIKSMEPATLYLSRGSLYAHLKELPKHSTFKIETPTAVAAVRGSEYQVDVADDGKTDVSNLSDSPVFISSFDEKGAEIVSSAVLKNAEFTQIMRRGAPPAMPRPMTPGQIQKANLKRENVVGRIEKLQQEGHFDLGMQKRAMGLKAPEKQIPNTELELIGRPMMRGVPAPNAMPAGQTNFAKTDQPISQNNNQRREQKNSQNAFPPQSPPK